MRATSNGKRLVMGNGFRFSTVFVVDSPSPRGPQTGRDLFESVLKPGAEHDRDRTLGVSYDAVASTDDLFGVLGAIAGRCRRDHCGPLLHLETHGYPDGLILADGSRVTWTALKPYLVELNRLSRFNLLVVVASCNGGRLCQSLDPQDESPAWAVLGPKNQIGSDYVRRDFSAFYVWLLSNHNGRQALVEMNEGPPDPSWRHAFTPAEYMFKSVFHAYHAQQGSRAERKRRAKALAKQARVETGRGRDFERSLQGDAFRKLSDPSNFFDPFYRRFFMIDRFPENAARFPISFEDCRSFNPHE